MGVHALSWRSADPRIATVDSSGVVWPRRTGNVTIYATAGGWRADSVVLDIAAPLAKTILDEHWDAGIGPAWVPFGEPQPEVVRDGGVAALWSHGDSSFDSGVYARRAHGPAGGIGIEARVSVPLTAVQWQVQAIAFDARLDSARLAAWDHRTGGWPGQESPGPVCVTAFPGGEGATATRRISMAASTAQSWSTAPADMPAGGLHSMRIQLFPDGRCGFAVDGTPVWISPDPVSVDVPFRVLLQGRSHGTRALVGPVKVWQGVRGDIDWREIRGEGKGERDAPARR